MSALDPENGDIIENPDPEADSEITDATEDEFHLNNYAENLHGNENVEGCFLNDEAEGESDAQKNVVRDGNGFHGESDNTQNENKNAINAEEDMRSRNSPMADNNEVTNDENNSDREFVEAEADLCDRFEEPEAELGHYVPEAELFHRSTETETESTHNLTDACAAEDEEKNYVFEGKGHLQCDNVHSVEQKDGNLTREQADTAGRNSPVNVPKLLKLTKSESVESYEPECDQDGISSNQELPSCDRISHSQENTSHNTSEISKNCQISNVNEGLQIYNSTDADSSYNVEHSQHSSHKNQENSSSNSNNDEYNDIIENDSSQVKVCVQDEICTNSSQGMVVMVTDMQSSCNDCGNSYVGDGAKYRYTANLSHETESDTKGDGHKLCGVNAGKEPQSNLDLQTFGSDDDLLSELNSELGEVISCDNKAIIPKLSGDDTTINDLTSSISEESNIQKNDNISEEAWKIIQDLQHKLNMSHQQRQERSKADYLDLQKKFESVIEERDSYLKRLEVARKHNSDDLYLPQIKELEFTISQQQQEIRGLRDKLSSHDAAAKRAISSLQLEMKQRIDQVTKAYKDAVEEKDNMVIKYAQAEKNNLGNLKTIERLESKLKDAGKEKDGLLGKIKDLKLEKTRLGHELDLKTGEANTARKDAEKLKEQVSSADVRIKWAQNKLKAELDGHKETKANLEKTNQRLKEAKEETEQIRRNCQEIIKTYQESEEIKSNSLDQQLKKKENELLLHQTENKDKEELYTAAMKELEHLKVKHRETLAELHTYQDKTMCLEEEHKTDEDTMNKFKHMLQKQKAENKDLQEKLEQTKQLKADFKRAQITIEALDAEVSEIKISNKDLCIEMEACRKREAEKLELTEKLSAKNAELQSESSNLNDKVMALSIEVQSLKMDLQSKESSLDEISQKLSDETRRMQQEITELEKKLADKSKKVDELSTKIADEKDEIKTLKRKHVNSIKDLTRQLQQTRRKLETYEANGDKDSTSIGSRTSSTGSLNTITNGDGPNHPVQQVPHHTYRQASPPEQEYPVITEQVEPDKQMLIERIVKLQRMLARRNEKIEFMDDHANQLIDELQKKNKIIQMYALREESGILTANAADESKAQIAKKHSIMGSVFSSHQTDGTMTLDLSLEINRKLQAVLEDTLLKNMTLKESLDTLGEEIARLSQENRKMQIQLETQNR